IVTIMTVLIVTVFTSVSGSNVSSNLTNAPVVFVPGPSKFYLQHNILSDGFVPADHTDSNVVNAWGLDSGPTTPWWFSDNGKGKTTLFNIGTNTIQATFTVPGASGA